MATTNDTATLPQDNNAPPSAATLEAIVQSLPSALVVFDRRLRIVLANQAAQRWFPTEGMITEALNQLAVESSYEDWATELRKVMDTGRTQRLDISVPTGKDQTETFLDVIIQPLKGPADTEATGGLVLAEDISGRISMERRLAVSERLAAVGKMAARVAHELNNPLDGILRYTNLARRLSDNVVSEGQPLAGDNAQKLGKYLDAAKNGIMRMGEIIKTLLEFSRNTPSTFEQATINNIVDDAIAAMEGRAREAGVTVVCNFHEADMPVVRGSNIFQVFCNLVKNAIDAMPDGGTLTVTTKITQGKVLAVFEDTGIGLPAEMGRIFDPFFTTKEPGQGTGLGLAVCKELIEKYSGTITAERCEPRGTRMIVTIPVDSCAAQPLPRRKSKRAPAEPPHAEENRGANRK